MTTQFEHNLENLRSKLMLMGQLANDSLQGAIKALLEGDSVLAKAVRVKDEEIDDLENELSEEVTSCLSTHAPVASDLRLLVSIIKISHEVERIGDEAKAIARPGRREGAVVEARVASMVAQSEAVMATGVALVMGAGIAAMAAVNGGRFGGGGGLDRARGASTIPAERSGSGKGGYSTLLWAHALVSGSIGSYLNGSCQ